MERREGHRRMQGAPTGFEAIRTEEKVLRARWRVSHAGLRRPRTCQSENHTLGKLFQECPIARLSFFKGARSTASAFSMEPDRQCSAYSKTLLTETCSRTIEAFDLPLEV
jgi:hypothetical protein